MESQHARTHARAARIRRAARGFALAALASAAAVAAFGCATPRADDAPVAYGPISPPATQPGPQAFASDHYVLYTTVTDANLIGLVMTTLERGYDAYRDATGLEEGPRSQMDVYLFKTHEEWAAFTRARTGNAAAVYLQIQRGGYAFHDWFAVRDLGEQDTLMVVAHEGFHQFIACRFVARPPPFIEEGLAATFESIERPGGDVRVRVGDNAARQRRLAAARAAGHLKPLRQLLAMHAGQVVGLPPEEIETFYAQAWAFVRFLQDGEGGRHRPAFQRLLQDAAAGRLSSAQLRDNPAMVERYLGVGLDTIEPAYQQFLDHLGAAASGIGNE